MKGYNFYTRHHTRRHNAKSFPDEERGLGGTDDSAPVSVRYPSTLKAETGRIFSTTSKRE